MYQLISAICYLRSQVATTEQRSPSCVSSIFRTESSQVDLALYLILDKTPGHAVGEWFYITWVYEVFLGIIIGSLLGFSARKTMRFCERKNLIDRQSYVAQYVSLAVLSIGMYQPARSLD
jgi:hypothetical protein